MNWWDGHGLSKAFAARIATCALMLSLASACGDHGGHSQDPGDGPLTEAELDALIQEKLPATHSPGLAACVVKRGSVPWCKGYGLANVEKAKQVTKDTVFLIASISKTLTATVLMQLYERGVFKLDDDVGRVLKFSVKHPTSKLPITYRGLLTHRASIRDNEAVLDQFYFHEADPNISLAAAMSNYFDPAGKYYDAKKNFVPSAPGTVWEYSNEGVTLAGYVAEVLTKTDFAKLTKSSVFDPLKLKHTSFRFADFAPDDIAMPYGREKDTYKPYGHYTLADYPSGGLFTSAADLARFLASISGGGAIDGQRILKEATVKEMVAEQKPQLAPGDGLEGLTGQGLGFLHREIGGSDWVGHDGSESGVSTDMAYRVSDGIGFVVLMNGDLDDDKALEDIEAALVRYGETLTQ